MKQDSLTILLKQAQETYLSGRYPEAAGLFEQAARQYTQEGDGVNAAEMANNRSVALLQAGDAQGALQAAESTDQIFAEVGDVRRQALAIGNQAAALEGLKRLDEALERYRLSASLLKQVGDEENRSVVLKSISSLQIRTGHQLEALATMDAALSNQKKLSLQERFLKKLLNVPMRMLKSK
jgi:tetratricopeptide (TPR) repeat protein